MTNFRKKTPKPGNVNTFGPDQQILDDAVFNISADLHILSALLQENKYSEAQRFLGDIEEYLKDQLRINPPKKCEHCWCWVDHEKLDRCCKCFSGMSRRIE
jgi:hypothetical protein